MAKQAYNPLSKLGFNFTADKTVITPFEFFIPLISDDMKNVFITADDCVFDENEGLDGAYIYTISEVANFFVIDKNIREIIFVVDGSFSELDVVSINVPRVSPFGYPRVHFGDGLNFANLDFPPLMINATTSAHVVFGFGMELEGEAIVPYLLYSTHQLYYNN